jgi:hypothetical protein
LPTGWERLMEVATKARDTYAALHDARRLLAAAGG